MNMMLAGDDLRDRISWKIHVPDKLPIRPFGGQKRTFRFGPPFFQRPYRRDCVQSAQLIAVVFSVFLEGGRSLAAVDEDGQSVRLATLLA